MEILKYTGGLAYNIPKDPGVFLFMNAQRSVPMALLEKGIAEIAEFNCILVEKKGVSAGISIENAASVLAKSGANAAIYIIDNPAYPPSIVALEGKYGFVNVSWLKEDSPDDKKLAQRLERELWRVFSILAGAANTEQPHCVLRPVFTTKDLDNGLANTACPIIFDKMAEHLKAMGIKQWERATYREACEAGWAPQPTNDIQRAIWEEIHAPPSKPLKITYDKAAQKPVVK